MRASRAGATGRSRYGSYEVWYQDRTGTHHYDLTSKARGERYVHRHIREGASWAELRGDSTSERTRDLVHLRVTAGSPAPRSGRARGSAAIAREVTDYLAQTLPQREGEHDDAFRERVAGAVASSRGRYTTADLGVGPLCATCLPSGSIVTHQPHVPGREGALGMAELMTAPCYNCGGPR